MDEVKLSVRTELQKIINELQKVQDMSQETTEALKNQGKETDKVLKGATQSTEQQVSKSSSTMRRMLDTLKSDLKSLAALESLRSGLQLSSQFRGTISETLSLSDTIRRLGGTFGIAAKDFASFQAKMQRGLGDIGLSSEAAANALKGLGETPVRGEDNLLEYSKAAGMLGGIGGEKGQEGNIAKGMAGVIQAKGGNVNDIGQLRKVAEDLRRATIATGKGPSEILSTMQTLFTGMSHDFRKNLSTSALTKLAAGAQVAGPNATQFIQQFLSKSQVQRAFQQTTGATKLFGEQGFDTKAIKKFYDEAKRLGSGDLRIGLKALGVEGDEAAEGFIRLAENMDNVAKAQDRVSNMSGDLVTSYHDTMGAGDAFRASINKVKGFFSSILAPITQGGTSILSKGSESGLGSSAIVAGGAALAAVLAGRGLKGIGGGLLGGLAKGAAAEAITGKEVQPVYVTNAAEIGGGLGGALPAAGGALGMLGTAAKVIGGVGVAGAAGYGLGTVAANAIDSNKSASDIRDTVLDRIADGLDLLMGREAGTTMGTQDFKKETKIVIDVNNPNLKATKQPTRGASQ